MEGPDNVEARILRMGHHWPMQVNEVGPGQCPDGVVDKGLQRSCGQCGTEVLLVAGVKPLLHAWHGRSQ